MHNYHRPEHQYIDIETLSSANPDSLPFPRFKTNSTSTIQSSQQINTNHLMNTIFQSNSNPSATTNTTSSSQSNPAITSPPFPSSSINNLKSTNLNLNPSLNLSSHPLQSLNSSIGNSVYDTFTNSSSLPPSSSIYPSSSASLSKNMPVNNNNNSNNTNANSSFLKNNLLSLTLSDLTKTSSEIELLINSNIDRSKISKDLLLNGYKNLQQLHNIYLSWFNYLNITDIKPFEIENQAVKTLSSMNTLDNELNDNNNSEVSEKTNKRIKLSSPNLIGDQSNLNNQSSHISSSSLMLSSSLYNNNSVNHNNNNPDNPDGNIILDATIIKDNKLLQSPKRTPPSIPRFSPSSASAPTSSKFPSSLSSSTSLDITPLPTINNSNPSGLSNTYGYGYQYQQYHYQQYQYQPSLPILDENIPINKYNEPSLISHTHAQQHINSNNSNSNSNSNSNILSVQNSSMECMHCSSKGTPEWRRGPNGERTLCNACGLFYSKLIKKYGEEKAKSVMETRKKMGKCMDRRLSIT